MIAIGGPWRRIRRGAGRRLLDRDPPARRRRAPSSSPGTTRCRRIVVIVVVQSTSRSIGRAVAAVVVDAPSSASRNSLGDALPQFPHLPPMTIVMTPPTSSSLSYTKPHESDRDWGTSFRRPRRTTAAVDGTQSVPDRRGGGAPRRQRADARRLSRQWRGEDF